jgi:hypothetical protein
MQNHAIDGEAVQPARHSQHIIAFLAVIGIIGTVGNSLVTIVYWRKKDKHTSTFFILVLALSDLVVCSILVPYTAYMEWIEFATTSRLGCKLYFFLTTTTVPNSSLIMAAIAFDRYFCICMVNRVILTPTRAKYLVFTLLCISGLLGIIPSMNSVIMIVHDNFTRPYEQAAGAFFFNENESSIACMVDHNPELGPNLVWNFKFFYDLIYVCSVLAITILYALIYKAIYVRKRMKRTRQEELLRNGCLVLTAAAAAGADEAVSDNSINRVIAITNPKVMNNGSSVMMNGGAHKNSGGRKNSGSIKKSTPKYEESIAGGGGLSNIGSDANNVVLARNRTSLKKCYCYFENRSNFTRFFLCFLQILLRNVTK